MPKMLFDDHTRDAMVWRIQRIEDESGRRWGKLSAAGMLIHLRLLVEVSLGEREMPDISNPITRTLFKFLAFYVVPFPKNTKAPSEYTPAPENDAAGERAALLAALERFDAVAKADPDKHVRHPLLGECTLRFWRRVHGSHMDHHLRQFGV